MQTAGESTGSGLVTVRLTGHRWTEIRPLFSAMQLATHLEWPCRGIDVSFNHTVFECSSCRRRTGVGAVVPCWSHAKGKSSAKCGLNVFLNKAVQKNKVGVARCCIIADPGWSSLLGFGSLGLSKAEEGLERQELSLHAPLWSTVSQW